MIDPVQPRESFLLAGILGLLARALSGPAVEQHAHYHAFAGQQPPGGEPHACNVAVLPAIAARHRLPARKSQRRALQAA